MLMSLLGTLQKNQQVRRVSTSKILAWDFRKERTKDMQGKNIKEKQRSYPSKQFSDLLTFRQFAYLLQFQKLLIFVVLTIQSL